MKRLKVAGAALNQTPLDWRGNRDHIVAAIEAARRESVTVLCLPELCTSGYGCEDAFFGMGVTESCEQMVAELAPMTTDMIVSVGLPVYHMGGLFNAAAVLVNGTIVGLTAKQKLAGDGIHYEPRWFKPWPRGERGTMRFAGQDVPIGDLYFNVGGLRIGFEICEDAWVADRRGGEFFDLGIDILCNPSASHFAFDKANVRRRIVQEGSRAFSATYIYSNLVGNEAGRILYDGGVLIAHAGLLVAQGPRLSFQDVSLQSAVVDIDVVRRQKAQSASYVPRVSDDPNRCVTVSFTPADAAPDLPLSGPCGPAASWETGPHVKEEEFTRAIALGLFDYLRKTRSRGFVVSLSGGADSCGVTVLCRLALEFAAAELGMERLRQKLGVQAEDTVDALARKLITCVYQATANSGEVTLHAARAVAESLGAEFFVLQIEDLVRGYVGKIEGAIGRTLSWESDDVALQNIQARVRSPGVWLVANLRRALLLSTSNRSEAAVGYATMDGDTSGGLAPISGIDKAFVRSWLRWMEQTGPGGRSMPVLSVVNAQQPTAELRPPSAGQTDESDLMPYPVLDAIEGEAIREKRTPIDCWGRIVARFPEYDRATLRIWVVRFFRLWSINQWKRERYAPAFHVDDKNLDPKTWCRFPILSGGFSAEIAALEKLPL